MCATLALSLLVRQAVHMLCAVMCNSLLLAANGQSAQPCCFMTYDLHGPATVFIMKRSTASAHLSTVCMPALRTRVACCVRAVHSLTRGSVACIGSAKWSGVRLEVSESTTVLYLKVQHGCQAGYLHPASIITQATRWYLSGA